MKVEAELLPMRRDNSIERLVASKVFWIVLIFTLFTYPIYRSLNRKLPPALPMLGKVPSFELTDSFGKNFGTKELLGRTYVANFIFTSCPSSCPRLTNVMQKVQKRIRGLGQKAALVSFTVDPETDTVQTLFKYSREAKANPFIWSFLTGPREMLEKVIVGGFSLAMGELSEKTALVDDKTVTMMDIAHSEKFALVDAMGNIRGYYDTDERSIDQLMIDIGLLVNNSVYGQF